MRTKLLIGVASILAIAGAMAGIVLVSAHADYERSEPDRNEVLDESPARVDVWFNQDVARREGNNFVRVFDEADVQVGEGDGGVDDDDRSHIFAELPPNLPNGRYIVRWMSTSDLDGEADDGAFCFYVGVQPTAEQAQECAEFDEEENLATPTVAGATAIATAMATDAADPTATVPDSQPTATPGPNVSDNGDDSSNAGIVVFAIIGGLALVVGLAAAAFWLRRNIS